MEGDQRLADAERELADARDEGGLRLARALIRRARVLHRLDRDQDAFADLNEVASRFGAADDLGLREQLAWSMWLRMDWSASSDAQTLEASRAIFALCNDEPSTWLEGLGARALARQADAHRGLGDLRAAIATRRWLVSEFGDVRPRGDPDLVYDQLYQLALDLWDESLDDSDATLRDLLDALEGADVGAPEHRTADAMRLRVLTLWRLERRADALSLCAELQARFADAGEPGARFAATDVLVSLIRGRLIDGDVAPTFALAREVRRRFETEADEELITHYGGELEAIADVMWQPQSPVPVIAAAALSARSPAARTLTTRRRLHPVARELQRLDCATQLNELIAERFRDDPDPDRRALTVRAELRRGLIRARYGRPRCAVRSLDAFTAGGLEAVSSALRGVEYYDGTPFPLAFWTAAMIGTTMALGGGPTADRTRATIRAALGSANVMGPFAQRQLRAMDARSD